MRSTMLALAALVACHPPAPIAPDPAAIRDALVKELARFDPIMQQHDVAALTATFTPDAVWIFPDARTFTGTKEIAAGAKDLFDALESFTPETVEIDRLIVVSDREAITFSHGIATLKMKTDKAPARFNSPFVDHWRLGADGSWKIAYEVNASGPILLR